MNRLPGHALTTLAVACVCACSPDMSDLERYVQETKTRFQGSVAPLPQFKPSVVYNAAKPSRDPFSALSTEVTGDNNASQAAVKITRPRDPLEFFPIDSLAMVGTLTNEKGVSWVLINDSQGTLHRAKIGDYIGQKQGQITSISEGRILVSELTLDANGLWVNKIVEIHRT